MHQNMHQPMHSVNQGTPSTRSGKDLIHDQKKNDLDHERSRMIKSVAFCYRCSRVDASEKEEDG